jgi:hypothetical protein
VDNAPAAPADEKNSGAIEVLNSAGDFDLFTMKESNLLGDFWFVRCEQIKSAWTLLIHSR